MSKPTSVLTTAGITREALKIIEESFCPQYYKVQGPDKRWYIAKDYPMGPSVKRGLTKAEADAYLKLLKEQ
jgi:hypothetical protein